MSEMTLEEELTRAVNRQELTELMVSLTNLPVSEKTGSDIETIRLYAKNLGKAIIMVVPASAHRRLAIRHLEDCVMRAVKALCVHQPRATEEQDVKEEAQNAST